MKTTIKKSLLIGTAIVAVGAYAGSAHAADLTTAASATWASAGTATSASVATATTSDNVDITTGAATLTITNDGTADDTGAAGAGLLAFTLGNVTDSGAGVGAIAIAAGASAGVQAVTIGSAVIDGAFASAYADATASTGQTIAVTNGLTVGTTFAVVNSEATAAETVAMTVGGALAVTAASTLTAGALAGGGTTAALTVTGNSTFTGGMTVTGGAGHIANTATLTLNGATNTGAITLTDGGGALENAKLVLSGAAAQTVAGVIAGDGDITVNNANGVTFNATTAGDTLLVAGTAANSAATLAAGSTVAAITLGDGANTDTNTLNLNGTAGAFAVTGTIDGTAGDTDNVNVTGGNIITQSGVLGAGGGATVIDTLAISGTGTTLASGADIDATTTTIGTGAILDLTNASAGALTSNVTMSGTLRTSAAATITGTITGASGTLDVNANTTVTGAIAGLTAIDVAAGSVLTANANVGATTTTLEGAGAGLTLGGAAATVATNIVATTGGTGDVIVSDGANTQAFTGNLGTAGSTLATLDVQGGGNANVMTTTGNLFVDAITVNAADTLSLIGAGAQTVSGTIAGGILNVGTGATATDATFGGVITGLASSTVGLGATARFDANATVTGTHTNTGTTRVGVGAVLNAGVHSDTGSYVLNANDANGTLAATDFGSLTDAGANGTLTSTNLSINVTGQMTAGTVQLLTGINTSVAAVALTDNSFQFGFSAIDAGAHTNVVVTKATAASLATGPNVGAATVLDSLATSTNTQLAAINANLASAPTQEAFNEIIEAAGPTVDGGAVVAGFGASVQSLAVNDTRLASLRSGETGMTAGNMGQGVTAWTQGFGKTSEQDTRDGIDGYDADTYGVAFGVDTENVAEGVVVGLALSYANSDVDSNNATTTQSDVDSYQVSIYGDYDLDDTTYVSGSVGYATNSIDQVRHNVGGIAGLTANADYDSNQYMASAEVGRKYAVSGATITPSVGVGYQHISIDNYTETGAGGANLSVDNDDLDILEIGIGAEAKWDVEQSNGSHLVPALHAGYRYDVIGDETEATSSFTGGGATFATEGADPAQGTLNAGASLTLLSADNWNVTGAYDYEYKSDYDSHGGYVRAGFNF